VASNFEKLQHLLEELFQLDQADLDFGIYRIMNQKRDEIVRFLERDLLPQVQDAFSQYKSAANAELQQELDKLVGDITRAGLNPDDSPTVQELRQRLTNASTDVTALENEVFSHLYNFFRRYYHEGDFISQRRYKEGVYAIPYEGQEVKLYHKDLGGFLRRELDFYSKNEVMHLDDIEHESAPRVEQYLSKIKVIRRIAHKIIQFLEQRENFQKKLWLKKKFVIETNYCITLDRVPEELYPEIAANDAQREEWVRLFAIEEIKGDPTTPGYSEPLTIAFLRENPMLLLDTRFFTREFV
jgi:hypothetical protein